MKFSIVVYAAPYSAEAAATAFNFDAQEASRHELGAVSAYASSELAGLGQLIDATMNSDRVINFG